MRYAKIKNGKIADVVTGVQPPGYALVNVLWTKPDTYPDCFYYTKTSQPVLTIDGDNVNETWEFTLKPVELIKDHIYGLQKKARQAMQLGSFSFGGMDIPINDREDSLIISSLTEVDTKFKVANATWATLTGVQVTALKAAHGAHVRAAYDWEESENTAVSMLTTVDELAVYFNAM